MLDRKKVVNWWTGRISDQELAEWTGMAPRAVGIVLGLSWFSNLVTGRGRGSRHIRRLNPKARNAIGIIQSMTATGMTFELATNVIAATPFLASTMTPVIDFSPFPTSVRSLRVVDPEGGWLPTDIVPGHIWGRHVLQCRSVDNPNPSTGDIFNVLPEQFQPNTPQGTMMLDRSADGLPDLEVVPLTGNPVYQGEIDPIGFYADDYSSDVSAPQMDDHLLIVNGRWVFHKQPKPTPLEYMQGLADRLVTGEKYQPENQQYHLDPISVIEDDRKTVRVIGRGRDEAEQDRARYYLKNFNSLLDVNMTLAVRRMKRRAYGLPVK